STPLPQAKGGRINQRTAPPIPAKGPARPSESSRTFGVAKPGSQKVQSEFPLFYRSGNLDLDDFEFSSSCLTIGYGKTIRHHPHCITLQSYRDRSGQCAWQPIGRQRSR